MIVAILFAICVFPASATVEPESTGTPRLDIVFDDSGMTPMLLDHEEYSPATVQISNAGEYDLSATVAGIRLRGNRTAEFPKKPMRIKFDKKQSLFGREKAKSWVLLANFCDSSALRNYLAYRLYAHLATPGNYAAFTQFVEVFVNGDYYGLYLLTDQIETGNGRVEAAELDEASPENTGYLLENDWGASGEGAEGIAWFSVTGFEGQPFAVKSPDPDDGIPTGHVAYIKDYVTQCYAAAKAGDWALVQELIDTESAINYYMVHDIFQNTDTGYGNVYMSKNAGGKLKFGPIWDFDLTAGNQSNAFGPYGWDPERYFNAERRDYFFAALMKIPEFYNQYRTAYVSRAEEIKQFLHDETDAAVAAYGSSFARDFAKWEISRQLNDPCYLPSVRVYLTPQAQRTYMLNWLDTHIDWQAKLYPTRAIGDVAPVQDLTLPGLTWKKTFLNWLLYYFCFGFIWMKNVSPIL
ncbi:MAG: CotH kinase family protein [Clostridium sp.]|jgi:hypothetical protein|nr:CotH kinase family protein [Clostridium sp.]